MLGKRVELEYEMTEKECKYGIAKESKNAITEKYLDCECEKEDKYWHVQFEVLCECINENATSHHLV